MSKGMDEAKPVKAGYDFGDEWLGDLADALDFDNDVPVTESKAAKPAESESEFEVPDVFSEIEAVEVSESVELSDMKDAVDVSEGLGFDIELDESAAKMPEKVIGTGRSVVTQTLNISALQKRVEARLTKAVKESHADADPLKDPQLWQFVSLIAMRLFDDLELLLVQKQCNEACDLTKQLNRLSNILAFAGLGEQLPLIAYIGNLLPVSFTETEIGVPSERRFDPMKMRRFNEKSNEFLNCLVFLLTYLSKRAVGFDTSRFTDSLERLYTALDMQLGQPSVEAPLPVTDNINPQELTTRTVNKLARTLEALVTESLHYIESSIFYGYASGFSDAQKSLNNASQIAKEYRLEELEELFGRLYVMLRECRMPDAPPGADFFRVYEEVCNRIELHFSKCISEKKIKHLRALIMKFYVPETQKSSEPFCNRWKSFIKDAVPYLDLEHAHISLLQKRLGTVLELATKYSIPWLRDTLAHLERCWTVYPESCAEALISLFEELRAFPTEDIEEGDIEQLNHERLRVLFARKPDARPQSAYAIVNQARFLAEDLRKQMEKPAQISSARLQELLIDARQIHCHSIARICEIVLSLLERIPRGEDSPAVAETVVDALYFCISFLDSICNRLLRHLDYDQNTSAVASNQIFYVVLLSLYQTPGQPRDGVTWFIVKRLNNILAELQLVWVNTATSTSTEYYCGLLRSLLHLSTICQLDDARRLIIEHLDEIPVQDFINTENRTLARQCGRIVRMVEDTCPKLNVMPSSNQIRLFFGKTISALNQLLSSRDSLDSSLLGSEISRIEHRMSMLGMTTDFPPALAMIYELHHLAFSEDVNRTLVEDLLYQMINVANNVCPEWVQPKEAELEFVKSSVPIPMTLFQDMLESLNVIYESLACRAQEEPVAWERVSALHREMHQIVGYLPHALHMISQNAQNRCRYLKKNIFIGIDTSGYPHESELPTDPVRPVIGMAFSTIVDKLVDMIIDNAFDSTDNSSRIDVVLHPFPNEFSASIFHNGQLLTVSEITARLNAINLMPAADENLFDLLVSSRQLAQTYPPVNAMAYILPILRQFEGIMEISDADHGQTRIYVSFKL
ncbi:MAG: hypothetical protein IKY83_02390 [Proteobacteria bacterium]|nr:hypothetical protein [Pseudomonadota bacterium]